MSWFRRRPRRKEPEKLFPYKSSPISEKILQTMKEEVRKPSNFVNKTPDKD
jgi:hypothetical protein